MSEHTTLEERLARSLDQQAGGLTDAPFTLGDVRGRATSIRRRRRAVAAGIVAAVVAVALPAALLGGRGGDDSRGVDPAPPSSEAPRAAYAHDGVVTLPGGRTATLPDAVAAPTEIALLADGRLVATAGRTVVVLAADGSVEQQHRVRANALTVDGDRLVAWQAPDRSVRVLESGVADPVVFPGIPVPGEAESSIDAILGAGCATDGCQVLGGEGSVTDEAVGVDGASNLATSEPLRVLDVSPDQATWAVQYADDSDPQFGCVGLYDAGTGTMTARSCGETALPQFSPDGERLLGMMGDGGTWADLEILDRDLRVVRRIDPGPEVIADATWETSTSLLVVQSASDGSTWSLVRYDAGSGAGEVVAGPVPGRELEPPYVVSE